MTTLAERIKESALEMGADAVGIASSRLSAALRRRATGRKTYSKVLEA